MENQWAYYVTLKWKFVRFEQRVVWLKVIYFMLEDPRLSRNNVRVHRRDNYEKRPVLSATIHPDIKRILVAMSERTGMSVSQVTDEVLYAGLVEMQELPELEE